MYSVLSIRQPAHHHIGWKVAVLDSLPSHIFKSTYQGVNWGRPFFSWQYCTCYFTCTFQILRNHQSQTGRSAVLCGNFVCFWAKPENASEPEEDTSYSMYCLDLGQWKRNCVPITWSYQITKQIVWPCEIILCINLSLKCFLARSKRECYYGETFVASNAKVDSHIHKVFFKVWSIM